ncbi:DUF6531 domain-containing protein [Nonomuraea sp. NPDC050643]|uniref:DUF6531 domain-containing protein n=1 Tax=Nonomuraea sp. NPDC050643 TaxID=3155660 RepID=UPI0033FC7CE6
MRRNLSWRHSVGTVIALTGLAPGLLILPAQPVSALSGVVASAAEGDISSLVIPQQMTGSPAGLSSLLPATQIPAAAKPSDGWRSEVRLPKGAVPLEDRTIDTAVAKKPGARSLPAGALRAEAADRATMAVPTLLDLYPKQGFLVDSLTPTLQAWGQSGNGSFALSYSFTLCDVESMSGAGCMSSGYVANNANRWEVPASKLEWGKQYWWTVTAKDSSDSSTTTSSVMTFTTGVRQPAVTSQLAGMSNDGQAFNQQNGNFTTTSTDLAVASAGAPLSVVRTYNSLDQRTDALFGAGWSTRWDMRIEVETRNGRMSALVTYPDGRRVRFLEDEDEIFQPPPGMSATLTLQRDEWRLKDKSGISYLFGANNRLVKITDNRASIQELVYGTDGKLSKVTALGGRALSFTWTGSHVTSVASDPVDGKSLTWTYGYDGDRLTQVCAPVTAPNCTRYDYGSGSLYRSGVLDSDPFGYWRLGESSGATAEDQGTGAGKATYQSVTLGQQGALAGSTDTAASFSTGSSTVNFLSYFGSANSISQRGSFGRSCDPS